MSTVISREIDALMERYRPSSALFFEHLQAAPTRVVRSPAVLGELYRRYQAGMHATRVMVYFLPHLDTPALRARKLQIYIDDDGLGDGDTHHAQLRRAFEAMGMSADAADDDRFGELDTLAAELDDKTAAFVRTVAELYARSLGAWCVTENFSDDWLHALADGLAQHHPPIRDSQYFAECFDEGVEERHGEESLRITEGLIERRPELAAQIVADARIMAEALCGLWSALDEVLTEAERGLPRSDSRRA